MRAWKAIEGFFNKQAHASASYQIDFAEYLLDRITVISLSVPDSMDVQAIFETLNGRGKPLSEIDLLKNHLLYRVGKWGKTSKREKAQQALAKIYKYFGSNNRINGYFRTQLQVQFGYLPEKLFYRRAKEKIQKRSPANIGNLVLRLAEESEMGLYMLIHNPGRHASELGALSQIVCKRRKGRKLLDIFADLSEYSVVHPVLFALLAKFTSKHNSIERDFFYAACSNLASFFMRMISTRPAFQPSLYEKEIAELAAAIHVGECKDIGEFNRKLTAMDGKGAMPGVLNDQIFKGYLSRLSIKHNRKAKKILLSIAVDADSETVVDQENVALERVLPATSTHNGSWPAFTGADYEIFANRLGNMCLLESGRQAKFRNGLQSFAEKRQVYADSRFNYTRQIAKATDWTPEAILDKQKKLSAKAAAHWRLFAA